MSKPTDEEIGRAVREYYAASTSAAVWVADSCRSRPVVYALSELVGVLDASAASLRGYDDQDSRSIYTTEDLRAALAVERAASEAPAEPLNLDIWSDEYAPEQTDEPLLRGAFRQESTVPGWLNSPSVTTQRPERAQVASGDDIDAELARYGVGEDAPSIFDGVEILF